MTVAVVLAGGANSLIRFGTRLSVEYVVEALRQSPYLERVIIAGSAAELSEKYRFQDKVEVVNGGLTPVESFLQAYAVVPAGTEQILIATGDVPLLTTEAANYFLETCAPLEGELFYSIVHQKVNEEKYPGVERTYVHLREGIFTGGNLLLLKTGVVPNCIQEAEKFVQLRKRPLAMAFHVGWHFLWTYLTRKLTLGAAEKEVSRLLGGVKSVGIICPYPEIGIDVDKESDIILVKKILNGQ